MSDDTPQDEAGDMVRRAEADANAELEQLAGLRDDPVASPVDLAQHPPELDYFEAELTSLRNALRDANADHEGGRDE